MLSIGSEIFLAPINDLVESKGGKKDTASCGFDIGERNDGIPS